MSQGREYAAFELLAAAPDAAGHRRAALQLDDGTWVCHETCENAFEGAFGGVERLAAFSGSDDVIVSRLEARPTSASLGAPLERRIVSSEDHRLAAEGVYEGLPADATEMQKFLCLFFEARLGEETIRAKFWGLDKWAFDGFDTLAEIIAACRGRRRCKGVVKDLEKMVAEGWEIVSNDDTYVMCEKHVAPMPWSRALVVHRWPAILVRELVVRGRATPRVDDGAPRRKTRARAAAEDSDAGRDLQKMRRAAIALLDESTCPAGVFRHVVGFL